MRRKVGDIGYQIEFEDLDFKRYIRTSDNIFDLQSYSFFIIGKCEDDLRKPTVLNVEDRFSIWTIHISQADTIEELCDGFRYVSKISSYKRIYSSIEQLLKSENEIDFELCDVFGCIETDEGLIYKAKMKGILPSGEIDWELL